MGRLGGWEWLVLFAILILLFGANKLPAIGKGLGEGIKNFRNAFRAGTDGEDGGEEKGPGKKSG